MSEAYKTEIPTVAELPNYLGKELGISPWFTVTQEDVNTFGVVTGDEQWIHMNPELSTKYSPYGATIAHGFFVLSLGPKLSAECYSVGDAAMGVNYGLDKVRFINATKVGARLRARVVLSEISPIKGGMKYKSTITFELEGEEKPACVAEMIAHIYGNAEQKKAMDALLAAEG